MQTEASKFAKRVKEIDTARSRLQVLLPDFRLFLMNENASGANSKQSDFANQIDKADALNFAMPARLSDRTKTSIYPSIWFHVSFCVNFWNIVFAKPAPSRCCTFFVAPELFFLHAADSHKNSPTKQIWREGTAGERQTLILCIQITSCFPLIVCIWKGCGGRINFPNIATSGAWTCTPQFNLSFCDKISQFWLCVHNSIAETRRYMCQIVRFWILRSEIWALLNFRVCRQKEFPRIRFGEPQRNRQISEEETCTVST